MHLDRENFEQHFRTHFKPLCAFARKYVNDTDTAKEIVHDVFIQLWEKRETLATQTNTKAYLYTSVYNRSLNYLRDQRKFDKSETALAKSPTEWQYNNQVEEIELREKIQAVLDDLPEKCREIFILNRFDQLKYQEIADKLDISIKTVETQMSKALAAFRQHLSMFVKCVILFIFFKL